MKVFKTRTFHRFCLKSGISDNSLCDAVVRLLRGQIDAELGGGLVKQRIARPNEGRSGGFRSVIVYLKGRSATFAFGFAKNERSNISKTGTRFPQASRRRAGPFYASGLGASHPAQGTD